MAATIRLTLTGQLQTGLNELQKRCTFMKLDEIVKLALSRLYSEEVEAGRLMAAKRFLSTQEEWFNMPGGIDFKNEEEMGRWWMENKKK